MTISYKWLSEYLPYKLDPERLSAILTSIGLEVEKMEVFEEVTGNMKGLVIGEVLETVQHPNADKLRLATVNTGGDPLQIVCGAPNVAAGQKVVVAPVGTTIHPTTGDPLTMKVAKIRGIESYGMICAEDEIGLGTSHDGIMALPPDVIPGTPAAEYFSPYSDIIYEIGLTPNRMDAMSHWGVARDVCAYLSHHEAKDIRPVMPGNDFKVDEERLRMRISVMSANACRRYSGVCIADVTVQASPKWLQDRLRSIGLRPINNIVDITNFIQHETGQPLHAFDYDKIAGEHIIVQTLADETPFQTLDGKERKLSDADLMICDAEKPICIAGVFGGLDSGVSENTKNIFIESAWFDPVFIRKTSFRHGLRTDAATRFEKGVDISKTVLVAERAAMLVKEIAGGTIASSMMDVYPSSSEKTRVRLKFAYLRKLSGKDYSRDSVKNILNSLGFEILNETAEAIDLEVPYHKPDISLPADIVEEILRIDGLDNIAIPTNINIAPSVDSRYREETLKEKTSVNLTGLGFTEILTNSITNSQYYDSTTLGQSVKLLNNLSSELDIMRPSMLHTALEVISFNINRKNNSLRFFEFGKTYSTGGAGRYFETNHLCLYGTGSLAAQSWKGQMIPMDIFYFKGVAEALLRNLGITGAQTAMHPSTDLEQSVTISVEGKSVAVLGRVAASIESRFDIRQPVFFVDFDWDKLLQYSGKKVRFREISKFPAVQRDLAIVVARTMNYGEVERHVSGLRLSKLKEVRLFDVFESEKLGAGKKSLAINFTFSDEEKTLTDKEIDSWMNKIMTTLEKELQAEIRK